MLGFGEPDPFALRLARQKLAKGLTIHGKHYAVKIIDKDNQSSPPRAGQLAKQLIEAHAGVPEVAIAWQGGEPTLMGVDFFRRSVELAEIYLQPGQRAAYTIQTNGTLLDEEWAAFFTDNDFLVGISIDGPRELHDTYRVNKGGKGSFDQVMHGLSFLNDAGVDWNALTTVHAANGDRGREVYRFLRDECGARFIQFIPIIERVAEAAEDGTVPWESWRDRPLYVQDGDRVTGRSVTMRSSFGMTWRYSLVTVIGPSRWSPLVASRTALTCPSR